MYVSICVRCMRAHHDCGVWLCHVMMMMMVVVVVVVVGWYDGMMGVV